MVAPSFNQLSHGLAIANSTIHGNSNTLKDIKSPTLLF